MAALLSHWRDPGARQIFAMIAGAAAFCFMCLARFRIVITEETLYFRSLFTSAQAPRTAIRSAHVLFRASASGGPLRLVVKYAGGGELDINAKVFSREAIDAVLSLGR
jgi:hypothetical protein